MLSFDRTVYAVKFVNVSKATKAKVLSQAILLEANVLPTALTSGFADLLAGLEAPAFVWNLVLAAYPGLEEVTRICFERGVPKEVKPEEG